MFRILLPGAAEDLLLDFVPSLEKTLTLSVGPDPEVPVVDPDGLVLLDLDAVGADDEADGGKSTRLAPLILPGRFRSQCLLPS